MERLHSDSAEHTAARGEAKRESEAKASGPISRPAGRILLALACFWLALPAAHAAETVIYSVYQGVDLGEAPSSDAGTEPRTPRTPLKDFFINAGSSQGITPGTVLEVSRKMPTYDLLGEKLYKEVAFPIARIKVVHAEQGVAIARLEKMLPSDKTPVFSPRAIMVGDLVRRAD